MRTMPARHDETSETASPDEAAAALACLSPADQRRLEHIARMRAGALYATDWRDLVQESVARILEGSRRWPRDVPLIAFLAQTMRSIATEIRRKPVEVDAVVDSFQDMTAIADPHRETEARDQQARVEVRFRNDPPVLHLMSGLQQGETARETQVRTGLTPAAYDAARKRFWRGIAEMNKDGDRK
jgi:RNA polymerase sigma-70 factor (ECF subfamily)